MLQKHDLLFSRIQKLSDASIAACSWLVAYLIRFKYLGDAQENLEGTFIKITPLVMICVFYCFNQNGLYHSQRFSSRFKEIWSVFKANTFASIIITFLFYFFSDERISRLTIIFYYLLSTLLLIIFRLVIRNTLRGLRKKGRNLRHILLIGNGTPLGAYIKNARKYKDSGIRFVGWIDSDGQAQHHQVSEVNQDYLSIKDELKPDSIVLSYEGEKTHLASEFIRKNYNDTVPIQLLPDLTYSMVGHQIEDFAGIPLLSVNQPSLNPSELMIKRFIELVFTSLGLIIISPFLFLITLSVKISSPGPIFFGQERIGFDGKKFTMWKFRSMKLASNDDQTKEWSNKDNPRKTKVGSFLRKTSIDELPQLWNVIIGDMSLVGPRPEQPFFVEKFRHEIPGYMLKHKMKPGITGWAQVNGWRGDTDLNKRIECDIYYIKNWSIWFDTKIIFLTFWKGFINKNAY